MSTQIEFLAGGGELVTLIRREDWAASPLGPVEVWPPNLRAAVSVLLNFPGPMFLFWGPRLVTLYNDAGREIVGDRHPGALGQPAEQLWPWIWSELGPEMSRVLRTAETGFLEGVRLFPPRSESDESATTFALTLSPIPEESGAVGGMFCAFREFTGPERRNVFPRRRTVERRRPSVEELMGDVPIGVFIAHDAACTRITMNRGGAEMLRIPQDSNASKTGEGAGSLPFRVLKNGHEVPAEELSMQRAARLGRPEIGDEVDIVFPDGESVTLFEHAVPLFDEAGAVRGAVGVFVDITERKRAETALREREERLRFMVELHGALHQTEDPKEIMSIAARHLCRYLGADRCIYADAESDGDHLMVNGEHRESEIPSLLGPWRLVSFGEAVHRVMHENQPFVVDDCESDCRLTKMDRASWRSVGVRASISVPLHRNGRLVAAMGVQQSASRHWTEGEVELMHLVVGRSWESIERARAALALRDADRRKDEFLATLSHELRNPLAPLRNSLHLLRNTGRREEADAPVHDMMERQVDHLVRLVDDLLEMSRVTRGTLVLRKESVELATVIRHAVETSNPWIQAGRHQMTLDMPVESLWVHGDPVRLSQVLSNLLNNAAKYTPPGGAIRIRVRRKDPMAEIAVLDTGMGISDEAIHHIFDMFSRGDRHAQSGLGIGLALARRLVEMHGGRIMACSEGLGHGSEFLIRLPLTEEPDRSRDESPPAPAIVLRQRILVVDDNRDAADSLSLVLGHLGADVRVAHDGPEALAAYLSYDPAVVLLDIGMPGMDGYEVARRIRSQDPARRVVLVALTGWSQDDDRRRASEAGFDHHLIKPADIGALKELLLSVGKPS